MYNVVMSSGEIYHYGVLGMHWGIRRYQNSDGSLTEAGKARYGTGPDSIKAANLDRETKEKAVKLATKTAVSAGTVLSYPAIEKAIAAKTPDIVNKVLNSDVLVKYIANSNKVPEVAVRKMLSEVSKIPVDSIASTIGSEITSAQAISIISQTTGISTQVLSGAASVASTLSSIGPMPIVGTIAAVKVGKAAVKGYKMYRDYTMKKAEFNTSI